ncbi:hypothetical protein KEM55_007934 [Ascosphaera atra]|nr:hypothetical protein KEM55_007934 [Ascosphaera atra]
MEAKKMEYVILVVIGLNGLEKVCATHFNTILAYASMQMDEDRLELKRRIRELATSQQSRKEFVKAHSDWFKRTVAASLQQEQKRVTAEEPPIPHHTKKARRAKRFRRLEAFMPSVNYTDVQKVYIVMRRLGGTMRYNDQNEDTILVVNGMN